VLACVGVALVTGRAYRRRTGGFTGDFLGATEQLSENAILVVLCLTRGMM
jgi:cobalamin synthase